MISSEGSYLKPSYDRKTRFISYWHQIDEILQVVGLKDSILEIGPGNGMMTDYFSKRGYDIKTMDIRPENKPDFLGSVDNILLPDKSFEVVACFQVLEHLPFKLFTKSLDNMARVSKKYIVISLPDTRYYLDISFRLVSEKLSIQKVISFPRILKRNQKCEYHFWEIGIAGFPLKKILTAFPDSLSVEHMYRAPGNPYHHFFLLKVI
ncbi:MAG: methyltransferase domain-containing protein [Cyanobacteria bacterium J06635_10]